MPAVLPLQLPLGWEIVAVSRAVAEWGWQFHRGATVVVSRPAVERSQRRVMGQPRFSTVLAAGASTCRSTAGELTLAVVALASRPAGRYVLDRVLTMVVGRDEWCGWWDGAWMERTQRRLPDARMASCSTRPE